MSTYISFTKYLSAYSYVNYFRKYIKIKICIPEEIILETSHIYTKALPKKKKKRQCKATSKVF